MSRKQKGRPSWFRMPLSIEPVINALDNKDVGRGLQLSMRYFKTGELPSEDETPMALIVFKLLRVEIDNSLAAYNNAVEKAKAEQRE